MAIPRLGKEEILNILADAMLALDRAARSHGLLECLEMEKWVREG